MAKQPLTRDRFKIWAEVEPAELGPLLAQLARMGLQNLGYELVTDTIAFGVTGPRKVNEVTGAKFAEAWLADHPSFKAAELIKHFTDNGRTPGSGYTSLKMLSVLGMIKKLGDGNYKRADVKEIAGPKTSTKARGARNKKYEITNRDLIWQHLNKRTKFKIGELTTLMRTNGREKSSATSLVSVMCKAGQMKLLGDGQYEVLKRPAKQAKKTPFRLMTPEQKRQHLRAKRERLKAAKLNGTRSSSAAETAHG